MSKLDAMTTAIAYAKAHIVTIDRIRLRSVATAIGGVLKLVESSAIIPCYQQPLRLIGGVIAIEFSIWALHLFGDRLLMRAIAPARSSYLRSD